MPLDGEEMMGVRTGSLHESLGTKKSLEEQSIIITGKLKVLARLNWESTDQKLEGEAWNYRCTHTEKISCVFHRNFKSPLDLLWISAYCHGVVCPPVEAATKLSQSPPPSVDSCL